MNKRVLLLGAGGFIGSHLVEALSKKAIYSTTAVDLTKDKLDEILRPHIGVEFLQLDIAEDPERIGLLIQEHDLVVNMVAIANPGIYVQDPVSTFELDFTENMNIIRQCIKHQKRLIHFSTSEVYGKSPSIYQPDQAFYFDEDNSDLILGPVSKHRWIYASAKQLLDRVIHAYGLKDELDYTIIRPFNYVGPRIDFLPSEEEGFPRVFSFFMDALLYGKPLYLVNGGDQKRCYTYIKDATDAHLRIIENEGGSCSKQIFNIGSDENETSIEGLAKTMFHLYNTYFGRNASSNSTFESISGDEFYGEGYDDSDRRLPNSKKIRELTGWSPYYSLEAMLKETMGYYIARHENVVIQ